MATTWAWMMRRAGMIGLFTTTTAMGVWYGCAGTNPGYEGPQEDMGSTGVLPPMNCVKTPDEDIPEITFTDNNCDGLDGDKDHAIFVAVGGDDLNVGSPASVAGLLEKP